MGEYYKIDFNDDYYSHVVHGCTDCGAVVANEDEHNRFHSVLNEQALCLTRLEIAHISEDLHNRFNVK